MVLVGSAEGHLAAVAQVGDGKVSRFDYFNVSFMVKI